VWKRPSRVLPFFLGRLSNSCGFRPSFLNYSLFHSTSLSEYMKSIHSAILECSNDSKVLKALMRAGSECSGSLRIGKLTPRGKSGNGSKERWSETVPLTVNYRSKNSLWSNVQWPCDARVNYRSRKWVVDAPRQAYWCDLRNDFGVDLDVYVSRVCHSAIL
jgi:hypothetical protein